MLEHYSLDDVFICRHLNVRQHHYSLVAMMLAAGVEEDWLKACFKDALLDGCPIRELVEACIQLAAYIGFPAAAKGMEVLLKAWMEHPNGSEWPEQKWQPWPDRYGKGVEELEALEPGRTEKLWMDFGSFAGNYVRATIELAYGDLYARPLLDKPTQQAIRIASLSALGFATGALQFHMKAGLSMGLSMDAQVEIVLKLTAIRGFPAALNAMNVLKGLA